METKVYNQKGQEVGVASLPEGVFGVAWNGDLVHQVYTSMMMNRRTPVAHTKMRGEVAGGGKKPWRQKGTGRARHGSIRSPIWVGGGVSHGPRNEKNFERKVNRKMKTKALYSVLSKKFRDGEILFVDDITLSAPKTKLAKNTLSSLATVKGFEHLIRKKNNAAYLLFPEIGAELKRSFRNIGSVEAAPARAINVPDVLRYKFIVCVGPEEIFRGLESRGNARAK